MQKTFELFIGSNNNTGRLERSKLEKVLAKRHDGFTIYAARGYWRGSAENTAGVLVHDEPKRIMDTIAELKDALQQEAIAFHEVPALSFA
jgi:hypothetical protein